MNLRSRLHSLRLRLRALLHRKQLDRDLADEISFHFARREQELRPIVGDRPAKFETRREFGNVALLTERSRNMFAFASIENFAQDVRFAARTLRKSPAFTAVAVLTLALGIGANTSIFSVVNALFLRPLAYPGQGRLVMVWETVNRDPKRINIVSAPNYLDWLGQADAFESMGIFEYRSFNISGQSDPEQVNGLRVSASTFRVLGVSPFLGRTFLPEEDVLGRDREVILSYGLWQRRFAGNREIVGQSIKVNGEESTVVGVMPSDFVFPSSAQAIWVPIAFTKADEARDSQSFFVCARLKSGVSFEQARAEMAAIGTRLEKSYPNENAGFGATVTLMRDVGFDDLRRPLAVLFAVVGFVLLIACGNVANLLLARATGRQKEIAVRRALGASPARIGVQLLTESMLLSLLGAVTGLAIARWTSAIIDWVLPGFVRWTRFRGPQPIAIDLRVLGFAVLAAIFTGLIFGIAPLASASRLDLIETLKSSGGRALTQTSGKRIRGALVAGEVALALIVLVGAGLMLASMAQLLKVNPGFNPHNVLSLDIALPQPDTYGPPVRAHFCSEVQAHVAALPGVLSVGAVSHLPTSGGASRGFVIEGHPDPGPENSPWAWYNLACPNYFTTVGIPLLEGRDFTERDTVSELNVIVISKQMARAYWPNEDPLGKRIRIGDVRSSGPWLTIVGVVGDAKSWGLDSAVQRQFYRPYSQRVWPVMSVVVRTAGDPTLMAHAVKSALQKIDPEEPVSEIETLEQSLRDSLGLHRMPMILLSVFGALALVLAALGIYGVVSYSVAQRTHEIGIRVALGANASNVVTLIVWQSLVWVLGGIAIGAACAIALSRLVQSMLFGTSPTDPRVLVLTVTLLIATALLAALIPARRAARVDPVVTLRHE